MITVILYACLGRGGKEPEFNSNDNSNDMSLSSVDATVDSFGVVTCENPELRSQEPLVLANLGEDWDNQPSEGYSPPEGFWFGGEGVVVEDFNQDNLLDIYVPTLDQNLLFIQQQDGSFEELSDTYFPGERPTLTAGASVADFNGDGHLDLFVLNLLDPNQLFESTGDGEFIDRSIELGIVQNSHYYPGSTWGDPDHDGDLDLLVLTSGTGPLGPPPWDNADQFEVAGPNRMYMNDSGTGFSLETLANHDPEPYSCCAAFVDMNLDYKQDLYIVNDFGMYVEPNQLFYNDGAGVLNPHEGSGIDVGMYGMGLAVGAFNDDQYPDFVVSDWGRNWLLLSDGYGQWYDATQQFGFVSQQPEQHVGWGVELPDVDNDGDLDIWVGYGQLDLEAEEQEVFDEMGLFNPRYQPDALYIQDDGQLVDVADAWGINIDTITRGGVWADLNNDGFLDLIATAIDGPVKVFLANCDDSSWIRVQLRQPDTLNTRAVGARVKVTTDKGRYIRWVLAGTGLSSSAPLEAHFGLGEAEIIQEIQVIWPDQTMSVLTDVDLNQIVRITR